MKITFASNYFNHHQLPFCEALAACGGVDFLFVEQMAMDEERRAMGWADDLLKPPFVVRLSQENREEIRERILESDVFLIGGDGFDDLIDRRLRMGRPVVRISERIYREGQWKAVSPRGLLHKHRQYVRYKNMPYYLLCAGAYAASDFALIGAFPGKMYKWGYFPVLRTYPDGLPQTKLRADGAVSTPGKGGPVRLCFAARMIPLKHPEYALYLAARIRERAGKDPCGRGILLDMIGGGELEEIMRAKAAADGLADIVTFHGAKTPEEVRNIMETADIFLFPSNHLEGWGTVINEAMNSGCAVIAGAAAGAAPFLIRHGENGLLFRNEDKEDMAGKALQLIDDPARIRAMGRAAYRTVLDSWNAQEAAERFYDFCRCVTTGGTFDAPQEGPLSPAEVIRPFVRPQ
ncbi:MAG: glycosyltransferase family 4 protein [Lachnospiraceae bacterium]|nr:glycosyltransferase family 4 protein [Lachnospiraceae bacterium]